MALSLFSIQNAKAREHPYKLPDGDGLHLLVNPNGSKLWRLRYRFGGKQSLLALGAFPEITLASARTKRDEAHRQIAEGIDPAVKRKLDKVAAAVAANNTFGAITREYLERLREKGCVEVTIEKNRWLATPGPDRGMLAARRACPAAPSTSAAEPPPEGFSGGCAP
jgi:hypothetical protein